MHGKLGVNSKPISNFKIAELTDNLIPVINKSDYYQLAIKNKEPPYCIINLDKKSGKGTHWVGCRTERDGSISYFDSFGVRPPWKIPNRIINWYPYYDQRSNEQNCGYRALYNILFNEF